MARAARRILAAAAGERHGRRRARAEAEHSPPGEGAHENPDPSVTSFDVVTHSEAVTEGKVARIDMKFTTFAWKLSVYDRGLTAPLRSVCQAPNALL
ncbi:hypothetical protein GCM10023336_74560 [Streptomyces similanensis]|uniref:Uncharacterized protein n=1 Tax=Streptomyces similanensis TaxID=1274988 RepID=A0ABP9LLH0_9ACTN